MASHRNYLRNTASPLTSHARLNARYWIAQDDTRVGGTIENTSVIGILTIQSWYSRKDAGWLIRGTMPPASTHQHAEMKANVVFTVNGKPIKIVEEFEYLGRLVKKDDKDGPAVMRNLARARAKCASMRRFLVRDAEDPKTMATFYRTVILYVLL
jgi:hypothetical protein